ncbi:MAG: hypothetical protein OXU71_02105 [Gammaproteobacteria bacterium]|nr:hypothetical protein [Gammaproteobacteria bacterium]
MVNHARWEKDFGARLTACGRGGVGCGDDGGGDDGGGDGGGDDGGGDGRSDDGGDGDDGGGGETDRRPSSTVRIKVALALV